MPSIQSDSCCFYWSKSEKYKQVIWQWQPHVCLRLVWQTTWCMVKIKTGRSKALVWKYFNKLPAGYSCKFCSFVYKVKNATKMLTHLTKICSKFPEEVRKVISASAGKAKSATQGQLRRCPARVFISMLALCAVPIKVFFSSIWVVCLKKWIFPLWGIFPNFKCREFMHHYPQGHLDWTSILSIEEDRVQRWPASGQHQKQRATFNQTS